MKALPEYQPSSCASEPGTTGHPTEKEGHQPRSPEEQLAQVHSFSRKLARQYGATAAILLGYLANRIEAVEEKRKDGLGFFTSIRTLAERYPYLTPSTIADTLAALRTKGVLKAENHNKYKYDRKLWYTFADPQVQKDASWDPIRFKVGDAVHYGIVEAVLMANLRYWIIENRKETPGYTWHRISTRTLAKHLPFSYRTLARAFNRLVELGGLERQKCQGFDHASNYRIVQALSLDGSNPEMDGTKVEMDGSNLEIDGSKVEMHGSKVKMDGSNPDNDIILVDSVEKTSLGNPHCEESNCENTFITPQAAPSGSCVCFQSNSSPADSKEVKAANSPYLPIPACGPHIQVGVAEIQSGKESNAVSSPQQVTNQVFDASMFLKPPVGYIPSGERLRPSQRASRSLGSASTKANKLAAPSVVGVSSSGLSSSSSPGSNPISSSQGVVAAPSAPVQGTRDMKDFESLSPFIKIPEPMASDLSPDELKQKLAEYRRKQESDKQAEIEREKKLKESKDRRRADYEKLKKRYASPYAAKEDVKSMSAEDKVKVLKAGLRSRLKTGLWSWDKYERYCCTPIFTKKGLEMARLFFELNLGVTPLDLLQMVDDCCEINYNNPKSGGGYDEFFYQRRATNLSFLLKHLPTINAKLDLLILPPDVVYLDDGETGLAGSHDEVVKGLEEETSVSGKSQQVPP